jgi:hypothetical protein
VQSFASEACRRYHLFDLDGRRSLASHGLRRAAEGQAGGGGSPGARRSSITRVTQAAISRLASVMDVSGTRLGLVDYLPKEVRLLGFDILLDVKLRHGVALGVGHGSQTIETVGDRRSESLRAGRMRRSGNGQCVRFAVSCESGSALRRSTARQLILIDVTPCGREKKAPPRAETAG